MEKMVWRALIILIQGFEPQCVSSRISADSTEVKHSHPSLSVSSLPSVTRLSCLSPVSRRPSVSKVEVCFGISVDISRPRLGEGVRSCDAGALSSQTGGLGRWHIMSL